MSGLYVSSLGPRRAGPPDSGAEDVILIDMAVAAGVPFKVFSLDTGRLRPETNQFIERCAPLRHQDRNVQSCADAVQALIREKGLFSFYVDDHKECCGVRKVEPLMRPWRRFARG